MTPQELKNSILQLAIQGKLVEQRPEEGTAEELFAQIQKEKQKLIAEKKIKKEKPLPEITDDEKPFDIPESWFWVRLGSIISISSGDGLTSKEMDESGTYPVYGGNGINGHHNSYNVSKRTLVIGRVGFYCGSTHITENKAWVTDNAFITTFDEDRIDIKWLKFYIEYLNPRKKASSTAQPVISGKLIYPMLVSLPPVAEQKRIVAKIEELLPYIDRYEQAWSKLEQFNSRFPDDMKKSLLQYAIQGKLVEQRPEEGTAEELFAQIQKEKLRLIQLGKMKKTKALPKITDKEIPSDFPHSWKVCYIDDIAFVTKLAGFEYTKNIAPNLTVTGIPLFKGKNVQNGKLVLDFDSYIPEKVSNELPRSQISKKCLLTPYVGTIGNIAIFDGSFKAHLGSNVGKIELFNGDEDCIMEEYVLYYLRSTIGYQQLTKYKKATAQESISIDAIRNVIIAFPPLAEQKRIVEKLEQLLPMCEQLK